jgi:hypothetical protein
MRNNSVILFVVFIAIFTACTPSAKRQDISGGKEYPAVINLEKIETTQERKFMSSFYKQAVKTIILETSENALIGKIDKLQVYNDLLIILDWQFAKKVFVFDKEGRFISTIGSRGDGPAEYSSVDDFTIDDVTGNIFLLDGNRQKIKVYQIETGKYIKDADIENEELTISRSIEYYKGKLYADVYCYVEKDDTPLLRELDPSTGKQLQTFFNLKEYNKRSHRYLLSKFPFKRNTSSLLFFHRYMNTIMSIDETGVKPVITVESKDSFTSEELARYELDNPFDDFSMKTLNIDKITGIYSCEEYREMVELVCPRGIKSSIVWYNTLTKEAVLTLSCVLDNLVYQTENNTAGFGTKYADARGVYNVIDGFLFPEFIKIKDAGKLNPKVDKIAQLQELTEDSNPIIFYHEYKE